MLRRILLVFTVISTACIVALMLNIFDFAKVEAEKTEEIAEISTKPSIVALATVMNSFRESLSEELLADASFPLGHKESYSWSNLPPAMGDDRGGIDFSKLSRSSIDSFL